MSGLDGPTRSDAAAGAAPDGDACNGGGAHGGDGARNGGTVPGGGARNGGGAAGGDGVLGSARQEAERLVATVLGTVSLAAARASFPIDEACECPVCRTVVALRDPDPEIASRLASGVGDLAEGVAGLLRAFRGPRATREAGE